jgi:inositol phosphorylceramide synthase catalytic subunit
MNRLRDHLRTLGPAWTHLTAIPLMAYSFFIFVVRGEHRWELLALFLVVPLLGFYSARTRRLYVGVYPIWLTALFYDAMRFARNVGLSADRVHVCDIRQHELDLFGITSGGVKMTLQDYFLTHTSSLVDAYCAVPYGTFIFVSVLFATFLYFKDFVALKRYAWTFFIMNIAAYVTYHVYPAAPPWYIHAHGCAVDLTVHASAGPHLINVDRMMGFDYFGGLYGRSSDVFGAVPSLHVAYPLLIVIEGWKYFRLPGRALSLLYSVSMIFAAVYLDHHWVIDVLLGLTYATSINFVFRFVFSRRKAQAEAPAGLSLVRPASGT